MKLRSLLSLLIIGLAMNAQGSAMNRESGGMMVPAAMYLLFERPAMDKYELQQVQAHLSQAKANGQLEQLAQQVQQTANGRTSVLICFKYKDLGPQRAYTPQMARLILRPTLADGLPSARVFVTSDCGNLNQAKEIDVRDML